MAKTAKITKCSCCRRYSTKKTETRSTRRADKLALRNETR